MNKFVQTYYTLFVSACNFSKKIRADGKPYEIAYWSISFFNAVNMVAILLLLKFYIGIDLEIGKFLFIALVFVPFFIINYYVFLKGKKYIKIITKLEKSTSYLYYLLYEVLSIILFVITGYINI